MGDLHLVYCSSHTALAQYTGLLCPPMNYTVGLLSGISNSFHCLVQNIVVINTCSCKFTLQSAKYFLTFSLKSVLN